MLEIQLEGNTLTKEEPISVEEVIYKRKDKDQIYAVMYNGKLRDLRYQLKESGTMVLVYADSETGKMIYERTLHFAFIAAVKLLFPQSNVHLQHALSGGIFCEVEKQPYLCLKDVKQIEKRCRN